jgi:apolipoprotein N-acyltransferase
MFAAILSLVFTAPFACAFARGPYPGRVLWFFPVLWVGSEFLRSFLFRVSWELLGYSRSPIASG